MVKDLTKLNIKTASNALRKKEISAKEIAKSCLDVIEKRNPTVNAYLEIYDDILEQAEAADKMIANGDGGLLTGIPLAVKDNILIEGKRACAASKMLENYHATYDATAIKKLKKGGAVFLGRANMDEFAMGGSTENSAYGVTRNPIDEKRVPGGSSGGPAAAVAMSGAIAALGSDTGGSVRQPSSFCGTVGLKPTYGAISRYGLMAMGSSLDQIGPITKTVGDSKILFEAMAGYDKMDSTSLPDRLRKVSGKRKKVIGVPRDFVYSGGVDKDVLRVFEESMKKFELLGYTIKDISLPMLKHSLAVYYIVMPAEVSTNLARFDGIRYGLHKNGVDLLDDYEKTRGEGFGMEVRRRILLGTYVLSSGYYDDYYGKANKALALIRKDYTKAFEEVDVVATPTAPNPAFKIGEKTSDPLTMYLEDIFTVPINLAGVPAISIPAGSKLAEGKNLPIGLQLIASHNREDFLFSIGGEFLGE